MRTDRPSDRSAREQSTRDVKEGEPPAGSRPERRDENKKRHGPISRRAFVLTASTALGVTTMGSVQGAEQTPTQEIDIATTEPYRSTASSIASPEQVDREFNVRVHSAAANPLAQLRDGDADIHVSGRPTLSVDDSAVDTAVDVTVTEWAGLRHDNSEWRECLCTQELRDQWRGTAPVETWSETDWESVAAIDRTNTADGHMQSDRAETALVRGRRSHQYARGFGGIGYYDVNIGTIETKLHPQEADKGSYTPIVKLGYLHVDRSSLDERITSILDSYRQRSASDEISHLGETSSKDGE